jgi:preprotein translocase subunit SecE
MRFHGVNRSIFPDIRVYFKRRKPRYEPVVGKDIKGINIMAKTTPIEYIRQVKSEMKKVTWPTKQETITSTIAVFIMVLIAAVFLFTADQVLSYFVKLLLSIGA